MCEKWILSKVNANVSDFFSSKTAHTIQFRRCVVGVKIWLAQHKNNIFDQQLIFYWRFWWSMSMHFLCYLNKSATTKAKWMILIRKFLPMKWAQKVFGNQTKMICVWLIVIQTLMKQTAHSIILRLSHIVLIPSPLRRKNPYRMSGNIMAT